MNTNMKNRLFLSLIALFLSSHSLMAQETERLYLSGHGCDDMVEWDFKLVGHASQRDNSGVVGHASQRYSSEWTKIGVPSCWELQGFSYPPNQTPASLVPYNLALVGEGGMLL